MLKTFSFNRVGHVYIPGQDSQSKQQLDFFESVQGRLHEYVHAKIQASHHAESIYKPFRDTSRVLNISFFFIFSKTFNVKER